MMKDIQHQWKEWCIDLPSIFVTYNGHAFDEELIRRQFWCNLLEPYITNTNQNGRLDLMLMIHNVAAFFSDEISIPLFEDGPAFSIKLEHLANEHGIDVSDAHDAISDCKFMIGLCKVIKDKIPEVFDSFLDISTKEGVKNLLYSNEFLALGEIYRRHPFKYPVVICGADKSRPNDICFFDLSFDPEEIIDLDFSEINKIIQSGGRDLPLKKYKINKTIPICSSKLLTKNNHFDISHDELQRRANIVNGNKDFFTKIGIDVETEEEFKIDLKGKLEKDLEVSLKRKVKERIFDSLEKLNPIEIPSAMVIAESENLRKAAVQQMGMDVSKIKDEEFPLENFAENATKRVRLGVILNKIIEDNDLKSDAEVVKSLIDERSSGFKDPEQYRNWIYGNEEQLKNIESLALEEQVTELLISQSKSEDENLSFEEVMTMS